MATKADCVNAAMKAGLDKDAALRVVDDLLSDRRKAHELQAQGQAADAEAALASVWKNRMSEEEIRSALARKQAALNVMTRANLDARIKGVLAEGFTGMDAVESLLVGSSKRFHGARDSIDARRMAIKKDLMGGLVNELEGIEAGGAPLKKLLEGDSEFNKNVVREIIKPDSTQDGTARSVAGVFSRHMEKARLRLNAAGASIGKLDGYLPQSHDAWKMTAGKNARQNWIALVSEKLDAEKSFGVTDAEEVSRILNDVYDHITMGKAEITAAEKGERTGKSPAAKRFEQHRVLHFKDADAFMDYHAQYGRGHVLTGVLSHIDGASKTLALMEVLGPNPETALKSLIAEQTRHLREKSAGGEISKKDLAALKDLQAAEGLKHGKVAAWWTELTGEASAPVNVGWARFMAIARATQSLAKLGGAALSAISDVFTAAMNIRVNGISWPEAVATALGSYTKIYRGKEKMAARSIGAFVDDIAGEMRIRWDVNEALPGKMAALQDKFFRWSGLNWITETGKAGYAMWFSKHLGEVTGKTFDKLDANRRAVLEYHGIDAARWEALRHMTDKTPDGKTMLVPGRADNIPESVLRGLHTEELAGLADRFEGVVDAIQAAEKRILDTERQNLRTQVMSMIADETQYAIIEPDAALAV